MKKYIFESKINLINELSNIKDEEVYIFLKKGIYFTDSNNFNITIPNLIIEGEDDTVIYDNRGHMCNCFPINGSASSLAHTLMFSGKSIELRNITIVNGCNIDFEYGGIKYPKISDVITQAYAFGAWNVDSIKAYNCKFLSILDTFDLKNVKSLYMEKCYTMGNNDFIGIADKTFYKNCSFKILGSCPMWSASKEQLIFFKCKFDVNVNEDETLYFTKRGGNLFLILCEFISNLRNLQMEIRLKNTSRYYLYQNTWNNNILPLKGIDETFINLSIEDVNRIEKNPFDNYNLLINSPLEIKEEAILNIDGNICDLHIETSNEHLAFTVNDKTLIVKNSLIGKDIISNIKVKSKFLEAICYFKQIGLKQGYPHVTKDLTYSIESGMVKLDYKITGEDDSIINVYQDNNLLYQLSSTDKEFPIINSDISKNFVIELKPKTTSSLEGKILKVETRIITNSDIVKEIDFNNLRIHSLADYNHLYMKTIDALYLGEEIDNVVYFQKGCNQCFNFEEGTDGAIGHLGLVPVQRGAALVYPINKEISGYEVTFSLQVEKKSGEGFGSANGQYLELWMDYKENSGVAIRIEREVSSDKGCFISLRKYDSYINTRISDKIFSNVYRGACIIKASFSNGLLTFAIMNNDNTVNLSYKIDKINTAFMLRHTGTIGIGNRFVIENIKIVE